MTEFLEGDFLVGRIGIPPDSQLGAAEGNCECGPLAGHREGQSIKLFEGDVWSEAEAAGGKTLAPPINDNEGLEPVCVKGPTVSSPHRREEV
jgi:hypothetical protein